LHNLRSNSTS
jgi:hypothetical protein